MKIGRWSFRQYHFVNEALKHVQDASIQSRIVLYPGVVKNTYSNGVTIYVNYSGIDYMIDGINLEMMSYEVVLWNGIKKYYTSLLIKIKMN